MYVKEFKLNGKVYVGTFNEGHEMSESVDGLDDSVIRNLPAESSDAGSCVYRLVDDGKRLRIGTHFMTEEEKKRNKAAHGGSGSKSKSKSTPMYTVESYQKIKTKIELKKKIESYEDEEMLNMYLGTVEISDKEMKFCSSVERLAARGMTDEEAIELINSL